MTQYDSYVINHTAKHFYDIKDNKRLYRLLAANSDWLEAKFKRFGSDAAFEQDLELALKAYEEPLETKDYTRLLGLNTLRYLLRQRTNTINDNGLRTLAYLGQAEEAKNAAYLRSEPRERLKGLVILCEALYQAKIPNFQYLEEGIRMLDSLSIPEEKAEGFYQVGKLLHLYQDERSPIFLEKALNLGLEYVDELRLPLLLENLCIVYAQRHQFTIAQEIASRIEEDSIGSRSNLLRKVMQILIKQQAFSEAIKLYREKISFPKTKRKALLDLTKALARGNMELALIFFNDARHLTYQIHASYDELKSALAIIMMADRKFEKALLLCSKIKNLDAKIASLLELLEFSDELYASKILNELQTAINTIPNSNKRLIQLSKLAVANMYFEGSDGYLSGIL